MHEIIIGRCENKLIDIFDRGFPRAADIGNIWPRVFFRRLMSKSEIPTGIPWSLPSGGITEDIGRPLSERST
jgi:hypothetical protein